MNGRRIEVPHNSDDQVAEYVGKALSLVETLNVPDDLRSVAFTKAAELFSAKNIQIEQATLGMGGMAIPRG